MADLLCTVIAEHEKRIDALKKVADKYGDDVSYREYPYYRGIIRLWLVDMPHSECESIQIQHPNREDPFGSGFAIIFKSMGDGVNVAPKQGHYMPLYELRNRLTGNASTMDIITDLFNQYGDR